MLSFTEPEVAERPWDWPNSPKEEFKVEVERQQQNELVGSCGVVVWKGEVM